MAIEDPARDGRSTYDYQGGDVEIPEPLQDLPDHVTGEVRFDAYTKHLYATDASLYAVTPIGVVFPRHAADVERVVTHCADHGVPVLPRGAGTSLAGQSVNEAVVLDFTRHMDDVVSIDPERAECVAQPGIVLATLDDALDPHDLKFAPDPAWGDKSTLGGAIGNNSTGAHSLQYGKTEAYVESCEVVLADGQRTTFGEESLETLRERADPDGDRAAQIRHCVHRIATEERETIREAFPAIHRNVSGYSLDRLVADAASGRVNLARLLVGSEGTLGIVTEATIALEPVPAETGVALLLYEDLQDALHDVEPVLAHDPAAVEIIDDVLLDLARETAEFADVAGRLPTTTEAVLLVECYAEDEADARRRIATVVGDRTANGKARVDPDPSTVREAPIRATGALEAEDAEERAQFWKLRKSGLPILLGRTSDAKHVSCIEDTAVPVEQLPAYVADVRDVLEDHGTFASFYAHAGPGCLHIRPLIDTHTADGVETMVDIADAVTDLAIEHGGSISGEHGDGRARSQWLSKQYGEEGMELFREVKAAFDPADLLNPGQIVGDVRMDERLRASPETTVDTFEPTLEWDNDNGFRGMVELCHGCGGCRGDQDATGGVMCPTYRAAEEEITSTRGRANLLRRAMTGELGVEAQDDPEFLAEVMDLCIGCKGCARDCPSEVDMARMKAEVTHAHQEANGVDRRTRLFANVHRLAAVGSATAPLSSWMTKLPGTDWLAEHLFGIAREQPLPTFSRRTMLDRVEPTLAPVDADREVVLLPDVTTMYRTPSIGVAACALLESAGVAVTLPDRFVPTGRPAYSMGRLDLAADRADQLLEEVRPVVERGGDVVTLEPSDASMFRSDYATLTSEPFTEEFARHAYGVLEYLDVHDLPIPTVGDGTITYHGHCHAKASNRADHAANVLETAGWEVDALDSGCCGMAGSFGYEAEHHEMSRSIGRILADQIVASDGTRVAASGASCRTQLRDQFDIDAVHPVSVLAERLES